MSAEPAESAAPAGGRKRRRSAGRTGTSAAGADAGASAERLTALGLRAGDRVRFRRRESENWRPAVVERVEKDGSLGLRDGKGASRAVPIACIEVRRDGPRGGVVWKSLVDHVSEPEQLGLFG